MAPDKVFTKDFILDMLTLLFCSMNYFMLLINMVGYSASAFGASSAESGLVAGLYVIGGLVSRVFLGKYVELVGRKRMLIMALLCAVVMSSTYFFVSSLSMLYIVRLLHGMTYGISSTCTGDIVAKLLPPGRRGEGIGYFYMGITVAMAVGPLAGLSIGSSGNYGLVFAIGLLMYVAALICAAFIKVPEEDLTEEQRKNAKSFRIKNLFQIGAVPLAAVSMVFYLAYSGVLSFISSYAQEIGLVEAAAYFYLAATVGTFISRLTTGRLYDSRGPNVVMIPGYVAFIIGMLAYSQTSSGAMFLCSGFAMGYGISIVYSVCQTIVVSESDAHRYGVTTSTFAAISDLGTGIGPSVLGLLIAFMGYREMYLVCALLAVISFIMYWTLHGRKASPMR